MKCKLRLIRWAKSSPTCRQWPPDNTPYGTEPELRLREGRPYLRHTVPPLSSLTDHRVISLYILYPTRLIHARRVRTPTLCVWREEWLSTRQRTSDYVTTRSRPHWHWRPDAQPAVARQRRHPLPPPHRTRARTPCSIYNSRYSATHSLTYLT